MTKINIISETKDIDLSIIKSPSQTMTSRDIAELTGKQHKDVMRDIRKIIKDSPDLGGENYQYTTSTYTDSANRQRPMFIMNRKAAQLLLNKYAGLARVPHRLREESSLKTIEQLLGITLIRQYKVLNYRIDGYDSVNNVAYEIDEPEHQSKVKQDAIRQKKIEQVLKCNFVRIKL